jgi:hypothetical protein
MAEGDRHKAASRQKGAPESQTNPPAPTEPAAPAGPEAVGEPAAKAPAAAAPAAGRVWKPAPLRAPQFAGSAVHRTQPAQTAVGPVAQGRTASDRVGTTSQGVRAGRATAFRARVAAIADAPEVVLAVGIMVVASAIYLFTSSRHGTNFDYFVRLADAFLHGRIYLTQAPSWLNELIPKDGVWYVAYPPMPAVVLMPFVAVFGTGFHQQIASSLCGGVSVGLMWLVLGHFQLTRPARWMLTAVFGLGTVLWFSSETGSAWLLSQSVAVMFATAALLPALARRQPLLVGLLLGCATVARLPVGLTAPFYLAILLGLTWPPRIPEDRWGALAVTLFFGIGLALPEAFNMLYNYARWGSPIDLGYVMIPGVLQDPIYRDHGILSVYYIPRQLYAIFLRSWNFVEQAPYLKPSWYGLSLFLTTPLLAWLVRARLQDPRVIYAALAVGLASIPIITHGNVGLTQFGYRFSLDVQPLLFVILATVFERGISRLAWTAAAISIATNAYGVWAIGSGFVSF